jgi:Domain of unknown function (DUF5103)
MESSEPCDFVFCEDKSFSMRYGFAAVLFFLILPAIYGQRLPEQIYMKNVRTVKFHIFGDPLDYPVISLRGDDKLELHFDDMDGDVKYYYYTLELRNADWTPAQLGYMDYVKGFTQERIRTYRLSAAVITRYTHYQAILPDRNLMPVKSGNYVLKVFLNGDTSQLAFTRRLLVVDNRLGVAVQVLQPFSQQFLKSYHRLLVQVSTTGMDVRYPQQQVKLYILQNHRWDNSIRNLPPTFLKPDLLEFVNEQEMLFPATREWRWLNIRSFRLLGDMITNQQNTDHSFRLFVKEDKSRVGLPYFFFRDFNGMFVIETIERISPAWEAEYATVHFTFKPPDNMPFANSDLYIFGEITGYGKAPEAKMIFNQEEGKYETDLYLKQGFYDYMYALNNGKDQVFSTDKTEGNVWESEDSYQVLVYFRELGGRYDQLLSFTQTNSLLNRQR